jgi:hypothetical protein
MSIQQMRKAIEKVYPGEKWSKRVSRMSDYQVIAIYNKFLEQKKLVS